MDSFEQIIRDVWGEAMYPFVRRELDAQGVNSALLMMSISAQEYREASFSEEFCVGLWASRVKFECVVEAAFLQMCANCSQKSAILNTLAQVGIFTVRQLFQLEEEEDSEKHGIPRKFIRCIIKNERYFIGVRVCERRFFLVQFCAHEEHCDATASFT